MILIDSRTGSKEFLQYFPHSRLVELDFGDFAFSGNGPDGTIMVGIERKAIRDLLDSMKSGRLWGHQIPGMIELYDFSYLVVEGPYRAQPEYIMVPMGRKWRRIPVGTKNMDPFLNRVQVSSGVMLRETSGKKHTARLVQHLYDWWQKPFEEHGCGVYFRVAHLPKKFTGDLVLLRTAQSLSCIGPKRGECVEQHFESVLDMVGASEEEWMEIPGIGKTMAKTIRRELGYDS